MLLFRLDSSDYGDDSSIVREWAVDGVDEIDKEGKGSSFQITIFRKEELCFYKLKHNSWLDWSPQSF